MTQKIDCTTRHNRGEHLQLVPDLPLDATYSVGESDFVTPIVREIPRPQPPKGFSLRHLQALPSLPDNVYYLPQPTPEDAA